jgi:eukaryotic-like serine/threonine-protein kinase
MVPRALAHYRILGKLGAGGMGEVYLAEDTALGRQVALKLLPAESTSDPALRSRLLREARAAAALDHPYACAIHEVGEVDGVPFIVMEYVKGETLRQRLARGPLAPREAVRLAGEIAEALEEAHAKGLVHRDLKPANVMLTARGHGKVMDFGLAKAVTRPSESSSSGTLTALTGRGDVPGTLAYMSPEQLQGLAVDGRSDLFALGVLLHEALTNQHPFLCTTAPATAAAILRDEAPPLPPAVIEAAPALPALLARLLAKAPSDRYASMGEARAALQAVAPPSGPASATAVTPRRGGRRRLAIGVVGLAGLLALVLATWRHFASPATALAFKERDWILVTDFDNQTGEPVFDTALETALTVSLQQSAYVNVYPRSQVKDTLKRMRREDAARLDEPLGREVALREGIKGIVAGSISRIGDTYLLSARLVDPESLASVYSESARARGRDAVIDALDGLAQDLRRGLGESLERIGGQRVPLPLATTSSLEALSAYARAMRIGGVEADRLLEQALELDPDFALAHAMLGRQYFVENRREAGERHFQRALALLDRLTMRESLWIRALVADWRGDRERGIADYRAYLARYPDEARAWSSLGYAYLLTGQPGPGAVAYREVLRLKPKDSAAQVNLATCLSALGQDAQAAEEYRKAFALDPRLETGDYVNHEYGFLLVRMGQEQAAARGFEKMLALDDAAARARGHRSLALLDMYRGRYASAEAHLTEAIGLSKGRGRRLSEMRDRLYLANNYQTRGMRARCDGQLLEVARLVREMKPEPAFLYSYGRTEARLGRVAAAQAVLSDVEARVGTIVADSGVNRSDATDRGYLSLLRGELALKGGRHDEAVEAFRAARNASAMLTKFAAEGMALAYSRRGDLAQAIQSYDELRREPRLGSETQEPWLLAALELGRLHERQGEAGLAADEYTRFVDHWRDGDADLPPLVEGRTALARLVPASR